MHENSQAYKDAWSRVRAAIEKSLIDSRVQANQYALDDAACWAVRAAFGMEPEIES